jgi:hypothetical protein
LQSNPPVKEPEIGAKPPVAEQCFFPLDLGSDFGEIRSCDRLLNFPGLHRHHGPPLAGFVVSGFRVLRKGWRDTATAPHNREV